MGFQIAKASGQTSQLEQQGLKVPDEYLSNVLRIPGVEQVDQELLVGLGSDGERFERALFGPLDAGDELHPLKPLPFEEIIQTDWIGDVAMVKQYYGVYLDPLAEQEFDCSDHLLETALSLSVAAVMVVQLLGSVYAQTDKNVVRCEQLSPGFVKNYSVGLKGQGDLLIFTSIASDGVEEVFEPP